MARILAIFLGILLASEVAVAQGKGTKKRRPLPDEFGDVVMNNGSEKHNIAPVIFNHWVHRARYTCRVCHVDLGFAMDANATQMSEEDNRRGFYCGACHNGRTAFGPLVRTATGGEARNCDRCHSGGLNVPRETSFDALSSALPRGRFGNNIDWEAAELQGKLKLVDVLPGVTVVRKPMELRPDYSIEAKIEGLPDIIFSHKKHAVWHGCELCHPDIFSVKTGSTKYTMEDVFAGKFCGECHGSVAFPTLDCQRCHVKAVH